MKLSNKLAIAAIGLVVVSTLVVMIKVKMESKTYIENLTIGNKAWIEIEVPLSNYSVIDAGKHFEVYWHKGSPKATIRVEENLKDFVKVTQDSSKVKVIMDSIQSYRSHEAIRIDFYSDTLTEIYLHGFVEFVMKDSLKANQLMITMENHAEASMKLIVSQLNVRLNDFSQLKIRGQATQTEIVMDDHSELKARELNTETMNLEMQDFCEARVSVAKKLVANCSDHSNLTYSGSLSLETQINNKEFSEVNRSE